MSYRRSRQQSTSPPAPLSRQISIEETYQLVNTARRKSSSDASRTQLRMKLGHAHMLEALETVIRASPPPSPKQSSAKPTTSSSSSSSKSRSQRISWDPLEVSKRYTPPSPPSSAADVDEYGYAYDDGEEDLNDLSLCRTQSRR